MRCRNSQQVVLVPDAGIPDGFGIYVHWPWCQAICPYCDFNRYAGQPLNQSAWAEAYCRQLEAYGRETGNRRCDSIYFGGGTPSLMAPETVATIISGVGKVWQLAPDVEITLEANPTSVESGRFGGYASAGVNRISVGVQSLRDEDLRMLGRRHTSSEARAACKVATDHFDNVSIDLIFGRQHQTLESWRNELAEVLEWKLQHVSLYQLTIERDTGFGRLHRQGQLPGLPDDDLAAEMQSESYRLCSRAGYRAYEVSSFARGNHESRHNLLYWRYADYLGVGPGAHSRLTIGGQRYAIETRLRPAEWLEALMKTGSGEASRKQLNRVEQAEEYLMSSLRLEEGMQYSRYVALGGVQPGADVVGELIDGGWLEYDSDRLRATPEGRLRLNSLIIMLLEPGIRSERECG